MQTAVHWMALHSPWFWPWCCPWSLTFSHPISFNQQILLPLLQNLSKTQALLTILNSAPQTKPPSHVSPRLIMIASSLNCWYLNLRGELSTPQHRFLLIESDCVSSLFKIPLQVLLMIKITHTICSPWPHRPHLLLWPSVSSLTLNMRVRYSRLFPPARMFFLKVAS